MLRVMAAGGDHSSGSSSGASSGPEAAASKKEAALRALDETQAALESQAPPEPINLEAQKKLKELKQAVQKGDEAVIASVPIVNRDDIRVVDKGTTTNGKKDMMVESKDGDRLESSLDKKDESTVTRSTDRLCDGSSNCRSNAPAVLKSKSTASTAQKDPKADIAVKSAAVLLAASMITNGGSVTTTQEPAEEKAARPKDDRFQSASQNLAGSSRSGGSGGGLSSSEQRQFVGSFVDHSKNTLGLGDNLLDGLTNVPVFRSAPPKIRESVRANLRSIVKMDAQESSPLNYVKPLVDLVTTPGFQDFGDQTLGSSKMSELNYSVAAAKLGKDNSIGRAALVGLAKGLKALTGVALPFAWANDSQTGSWTTAAAKAGAKAKFAALFGADSAANGGGEIIPEGEAADLIEIARGFSAPLFNRAPSSLAPNEAQVLRGRQDLEALIRSLKNLKSLDLVSLLQSPSPIDRAAMSSLSSDKILEELMKMVNKAIPDYKDNTRVSSGLLKEKTELEQLKTFNTSLLEKFRGMSDPIRQAALAEEVFANDKVRFLWRKYFEDGYRALRRATAMLIVSVRTRGVGAKDPDALGLLMSEAQARLNKDREQREIARQNRYLEESNSSRSTRRLPTIDEERW